MVASFINNPQTSAKFAADGFDMGFPAEVIRKNSAIWDFQLKLLEKKDTNQIVKNMVKRLNIDLHDHDISTSHRLPAVGDKHPPIIARFCNRDLKNNIYQKRRNLIGVRDFGIEGMTALYVNENLTHRRRNLFTMAYKQKSLLKYQFIWTVNGEIFMRKCTSSEKIRIANEQDINNLK